MASQGEKTTAKDEGEVKSTPSSQEVAPPLISSTKGINLFTFILVMCLLFFTISCKELLLLILYLFGREGNFFIGLKFSFDLNG